MGWCISCHEEKLQKKFDDFEKIHPNISKLSEHEKRNMSHTGRIQSRKLYKDFDRKLGDEHKLNKGKEKLININKEVAWLKDCSTCHY